MGRFYRCGSNDSLRYKLCGLVVARSLGLRTRHDSALGQSLVLH
ncbi:unnamed protein product [Larinioides sclopetarius]|uniref:Uncharacterized protein n=1 Tax=Larinioides sclopetarius TaxID=280406 RepID=A0AAV1Z2Z6_9ARAC